MSKAAVVAFLMIGALGMVGADCGAPRPPRPEARVASALPGNCDGFVDYGDEFEVTYLQTAGMSLLGFGMIEVDLDVEIRNAGDARFRAASMVPDFSNATDLGVLVSPAPLPAEFGPLDPGAIAWSTVPLRLQLPAVHYGDLLQQLGNGTIPLVVHGDEVNVLAPGVELRDWTANEDRMYYLASQPAGGFGNPVNADPGPGPFAPGQEFIAGFLEFSDDVSSVFDDFQAGEVFYLVENPDAPLSGGPLENIPDVFDRVRVVSAERGDDEDDGFTFWLVTLKITDDESLPEIYSTASFCTGTSTHVDPPVQATRTLSLDRHDLDDETRDRNEQPIRVNELTFSDGIVTFSGQIAGHVLKPSLSLRLRDGHVETGVTFDTDISFTAEVRAEDEVVLEPEDVPLWTHCFPLPSIPAGPVSIPLNLQLDHTVGMGASLAAGAVVGFSKHFESGFSITCQGGPGVPEGCSSDGHRNPTPIEFTPPQLTDDTAASMRVETTLTASLRVGSPYPICDAGPGASLVTTAYGELSVSPTLDPWWSSSYGLEVTASLELELLGLDVARYETDVASFVDGASSADALVARGAAGPRSSGEDQRWAVAIDDIDVPNGVSGTAIEALPDGSSLAIASEAVSGRNPLVKLDRFGALVWAKNFTKRVNGLHALPDGTAIAFGFQGSDAWLVRVDADGNLVWSSNIQLSRTSYTPGRCSINDVAPLEQSPGVYDYVAVGTISTGLVTTTDACAFRVNADGTIAWSRIYVGPSAQGFDTITATREGNVVVGGADYWNYTGTRSIPVFVKLDAGDGDVLFAKGMPLTRLGGIESIVEASDGRLYGVGGAQGTVLTTGAAFVSYIEADGSDGRQSMLFQDEDWEALFDFETWVDTAGGDTAYDEFFGIEQSGDGFVVVGRTGLGAETAARVAKLNSKLGVEWFTTFDGASTENLTGVAPAPDGIFVSGYSESLPEADGGSGENQLWVMKLPFTGTLAFLPDVAMTARFVVPGVRDTSVDPGPNPLDERLIDMSYTTEETVFLSAAPNPALLAAGRTLCVELLTPTGHTTTLDTCAD